MLKKDKNINIEEVMKRIAQKNHLIYVEPGKRKKLDKLFHNGNDVKNDGYGR